MADTALSVLQDVFEKAKIYAPGVTINTADTSRGLSVINKMLDSWSNERLACFANLEQSFPLVPGKRAYTIGTSGGADINAVRPLEILMGPGAAYLRDTNQNRYPVDVVNQDQWNLIGLLEQSSDLPDTLFYDPQFPLGIINIFAKPLQAFTLFFDARLQLQDMANLTQVFSLPPGYIQAIVDNATIKIWPYYKQGDPPARLIEEAKDSLAAIKRTNIKQSPAMYDAAVVSRAQGSYNIYSDAANRSNR